jgi:XPG I-region
MEKAILHRILRLLQFGVKLHFVFDGPKRPPKRGIAWRSAHDKSMDLLQNTLNILGISWHNAIAEVEADCAELQKRGIVDAVWTEVSCSHTNIRHFWSRTVSPRAVEESGSLIPGLPIEIWGYTY